MRVDARSQQIMITSKFENSCGLISLYYQQRSQGFEKRLYDLIREELRFIDQNPSNSLHHSIGLGYLDVAATVALHSGFGSMAQLPR